MNEVRTNDLHGSPASAATSALRNVGNGASQAAHDLSETVATEAGHVGHAAREWWQQHKTDAIDAMHGARERAQRVTEHSREYVRAQPVRSMMIAAGIGALISAVWMMALRRER